MIRRYLPKSTEELIRWYERRVAPVSLLLGFILDNVIFRAIDFRALAFALTIYLVIAVLGILALNLVETGRVRNSLALRAAPFFPVIVQFAFGGIFSGFFVLYSESATIAVSWISVGVLAFLLIGNERFRLRYRRFSFQAGVLFIAFLGFFFFLAPFVFKRIGPEMFFVSSLASVALIAFYMMGVNKILPELVRANLTKITRNVGAIFLFFSFLYFTNAIPPLPLALKEANVYHRVELVTAAGGSEYLALQESMSWYREYVPFGKVFHRAPGEPIYVFSAVFAPSGLSTNLTHQWQNYNPSTEEWDTVSTVTFPVIGGRDGGYRGFSMTTNPLSGEWRVNVMTPHGQVVGRISFTVVDVTEPLALEEKIL